MKVIDVAELPVKGAKLPKCLEVMEEALKLVKQKTPVRFEPEDGAISALRSALEFIQERDDDFRDVTVTYRHEVAYLIKE